MRKVLLVVVVSVLVAGAGLTLFNLTQGQTKVRDHAIATAGLREIVVRSESGDVRVISGGRGSVAVRETQHYTTKRPALDRDYEDGVLTLDSNCSGGVWFNCSADLRVSVPAGVTVTVDADSGDVHADGVESGEVHLKSDSGDVHAEVSGRQRLVWAHSDSGSVSVDARDALGIDAQTDSGDVKVDAAGRVRRVVAHSDSGDVEVGLPPGEYAVRAETDSGDVEVEDEISRNDRAARSVQAATDSGDVAVRAR